MVASLFACNLFLHEKYKNFVNLQWKGHKRLVAWISKNSVAHLFETNIS